MINTIQEVLQRSINEPRMLKLVTFTDGAVLKATKEKELYVVNGMKYGYGDQPIVVILDKVPDPQTEWNVTICPWNTVDTIHF